MKTIHIEKLTALHLRAKGSKDTRKGKRMMNFVRKFCQTARRGSTVEKSGKDAANMKWLRHAKKVAKWTK